jgi:integrase
MGSLYRPKYKDRHGEERTSAVWWIQYYAHGRKIRESAETADLGEAKDLLKKREGVAVDQAPTVSRKITMQDLLQDLVNDYKINGYRSLVDLERRLNLHILPFFGKRKAAAIDTAEIRRFINQRQDNGAANAEINREMTAMKRAYTLGIQAGKVAIKPYFPMLKESSPRAGFFEHDQLDAIIRKLEAEPRAKHLTPIVKFAYITGWRKSEVLGLQWPQVDFQAGIIRLEPGTTKNDEARIFPFTSELREILEGQRAKADELAKKKGRICPYVFNRHGKQIKDFKSSWTTARESAGIPGNIFHDFRRTAVRNLVRAGIPERVAMKMTGHKTRSVFERYNIVSEADLFEAARRLEVFSDKDTGKDTTATAKSLRVLTAKGGSH